MSKNDAERWNSRYADGAYEGRVHASQIVEHWADCSPCGRALDVACGRGRNAVYLASKGFEVDAVDVSSVALEHGANRARELDVSVNWIEADLDDYSFDNGPYQLIVVARFLNRNMMPSLLNALADGGYLIYETHLQSTIQNVGGPSSARFRLLPQELLHLAYPLRVVHYFEGIANDPDGAPMALAQLVGCKGDGGF